MATEQSFLNPSNHSFVPSIYCKQCSKLEAGHLPTPKEIKPMATEFTAARVEAQAEALTRRARGEGSGDGVLLFQSAAMLRLLAEKLREEEDEAAERKHCDDETRRCGDGGDGPMTNPTNKRSDGIVAPDAETGPLHHNFVPPHNGLLDWNERCRQCGYGMNEAIHKNQPVDAGTGEAPSIKEDNSIEKNCIPLSLML